MQSGRKQMQNKTFLQMFPPRILVLLLLQIAIVNGVLVVGSIYIGKFLDAHMNTQLVFTVVLAVVSLQFALFLTYKLGMRAVAKLNQADARAEEAEPPVQA
jgi:hypothetical protein